MINAHQLSRACREPGYTVPTSPDPPRFMTVPTTCARAAVRLLHTQGPAAGKRYLGQSKVGEWANHANASMASGARNVLDGFDWYADQEVADGRPMKELDADAVVSLHGNDVAARLDVVLDDGEALAGRVILWDGPDFEPTLGPVMACAFAHALQSRYPARDFTTVGIWQARRQRLVEVPHSAALAKTAAAGAIAAAI